MASNTTPLVSHSLGNSQACLKFSSLKTGEIKMIEEKEIFKSSDGYKIIVGESKEADRKGMLAARMELPLGVKVELGHFPAKQLLLMKQNFDAKLAQNINQYNAVVQQNQNLQKELSAYRHALIAISQNSDCVCSLDDTCRPQRIAMNALTGINSHESVDEQQLKKKIIEFLTEMSSQNNRGTRFPYYYTIADEKERFELDYHGDFYFNEEDGQVQSLRELMTDVERFGEAALSKETADDYFENITLYHYEINEWLSENGLEDVQRFSQEYDTVFDGVLLTESDANEYLKSTSNHLFGPNPRTFVKCMASWSRKTKTGEFFEDLFKFFGVKIPPAMYYDSKKSKEGAEQ